MIGLNCFKNLTLGALFKTSGLFLLLRKKYTFLARIFIDLGRFFLQLRWLALFVFCLFQWESNENVWYWYGNYCTSLLLHIHYLYIQSMIFFDVFAVRQIWLCCIFYIFLLRVKRLSLKALIGTASVELFIWVYPLSFLRDLTAVFLRSSLVCEHLSLWWQNWSSVFSVNVFRTHTRIYGGSYFFVFAFFLWNRRIQLIKATTIILSYIIWGAYNYFFPICHFLDFTWK